MKTKKVKSAGRATRKTRQTTRRTIPNDPAAVREIPVQAIDWSHAARLAHREHVERLADAVTLPAVVVWEFERGKFRGVDGLHRWLLARGRGEQTVRATVRHYETKELGEQQCDLDAVGLNVRHGLPLTREERDRAIVRLWTRWGRTHDRPNGVTLENLAKTFNLTKGRIHQVVSANPQEQAPDIDEVSESVDRPSPGTGFSPFGRFSAAAKRLSTVLGDASFVAQLLRDRQSDVQKTLHELRDLLNTILKDSDSLDRGSSREKVGIQRSLAS
jgi:hypothetical protein